MQKFKKNPQKWLTQDLSNVKRNKVMKNQPIQGILWRLAFNNQPGAIVLIPPYRIGSNWYSDKKIIFRNMKMILGLENRHWTIKMFIFCWLSSHGIKRLSEDVYMCIITYWISPIAPWNFTILVMLINVNMHSTLHNFYFKSWCSFNNVISVMSNYYVYTQYDMLEIG